MFSCLGVMIFIGIRFWTPYRVERFETGFGYMQDMLAQRTQYCSYFHGLTVLCGVSCWLYVNKEAPTTSDELKFQWTFMGLMISNAIQLVSFIVANVLSYT